MHQSLPSLLGLADVLTQALAPVAPQLRIAFVFGSVACGGEASWSGTPMTLTNLLGISLDTVVAQARGQMLKDRLIRLCGLLISTTSIYIGAMAMAMLAARMDDYLTTPHRVDAPVESLLRVAPRAEG